MSGRIITCDSCGRDRRKYCKEPWCQACWNRWDRAGRPDAGPPPRRTGRYGEYYELTREQGYSLKNAAARMGISPRTAQRHEAHLRREGVLPVTYKPVQLGIYAYSRSHTRAAVGAVL